MTEGAALPPPPAFPDSFGPDNHEYGFQYEGWEEIPVPSGLDWFRPEERYRRNANAASYREQGDPVAWIRYLTLGFFAFTDCNHFDRLWARRETDAVTLHRVIWYQSQFMSHVQKEMPIPDKLNAWALQITHPFLEVNDPTALDVNTSIPWKELNYNNQMDTDDNGEWLPVQGKRRGREVSPPKKSRPQFTTNQLTLLSRKPAATPKELLTADKDYRKLVKPVAREPQMTTVTEDDEEEAIEVDNITMADSTMASKDDTQSGYTSVPKPAPFQPVSVNDGTHRVKFKWTVSDDMRGMEDDPVRLNDVIKDLMTAMFHDDDGMLYRWQSDDLRTSSIPSAMTSSEIRDHISPAITHLKSKSMIIFGIRFGFTDNPIKWQMEEKTKQIMKEKQVEVTISNSTSTSGSIVTAGYILLKSPNSTSTHRYTQHLRSQLPDATPYFDVMKFRKTPYDQPIPHLAVQCGEKHVTPVSQALSKILSGKNGAAVFLPRYVFSELTDQQIEHQFESHHKWNRSLKPISLAPLVFHLDQKRIEYSADGTIIERSTREWVATLTNPDGTPALCDVVNGTSNKKALLLAPEHYEEKAKAELKKYRLRLHPPRHREERFRDRVHDLPAVIHIQTAIESNVQYIENIFANDTWKSLSAEAPTKNAGRKSTKSHIQQEEPNARASRRNAPPQAWKQPPNIPRTNDQTSFPKISKPDTQRVAVRPSDQYDRTDEEERSTASTQGTTTIASDSALHAKLHEIESATKSKLSRLENSSKQSVEKLQQLETQMQKFSDLDRKVSSMERDLTSMSVKLDDSVTTQQELVENLKELKKASTSQFNSVSDHLVTSGENVNQLTDAMAAMRNEMGRLSTIIQGIASRQLDHEVATSTQRPSPQSVQELQSESLETSQPMQRRSNTTNDKIRNQSSPLNGPARTLREAARQIPLPDSSSDNSIASSTSKKSHSSVNTTTSDASESSQASSTIRSPPPKKTRQGGIPMSAPTVETMQIESDTEKHDDQDIFNDDIHMFDAVITEALRTNLTSRFDASMNTESDQPLTQDLTEQVIPPDSLSDIPMQMATAESLNITTDTAPLNSRNNHQLSSAGAETS